jgi:hypothetical protein
MAYRDHMEDYKKKAMVEKFHIGPKGEHNLTKVFLNQLAGCADDSCRRLLLGKSK